jgi:translation initiation factor eIF-2B subunit delta
MSEPQVVPFPEAPKPEKKVKAPPPGGYAKKPQLTKAERRELQEKQRAEKEKGRPPLGAAEKAATVVSAKKSPEAVITSVNRDAAVTVAAAKPPRPKHLFAHLTPFSPKTSESLGAATSLNDVHPAVVALGLR